MYGELLKKNMCIKLSILEQDVKITNQTLLSNSTTGIYIDSPFSTCCYPSHFSSTFIIKYIKILHMQERCKLLW